MAREGLTRRQFIAIAGSSLLSHTPQAKARSGLENLTVAGLKMPSTKLTQAAAALSRAACPPFLFNHCMRTYFFGALHARHHGQSIDQEVVFAAAALHDLGLLEAYEKDQDPFEVDGANAAESFARKHGASETESRLIWDSVVFHDMRWSIVSRQSQEATAVAIGAGTDVDGPDYEMFSRKDVEAVLQAFPRLAFKMNFQKLLASHCERQPNSQAGTWLEDFCRCNKVGKISDVARAMDKAGFKE